MAEQRRILVYADWHSLFGPRLMGRLHANPAHGTELFSFEYDSGWLRDAATRALDPRLGLFSGPQYPSLGAGSFGLFMDSAPDRWGRFLMDRRESLAARQSGAVRRQLHESDYLLGVHDGQRMGALRFKLAADGPFLDNQPGRASPPWASLRELEYASLQVGSREAVSDSDLGKWLQMLIAPGASLGGARPKAGVVGPDGCLWIAKFPSRDDGLDKGAWEYVAQQLARACGIAVADAAIRKFTREHHTFLAKRFDRTPGGGRLHFASAMTLLNRLDGDDAAAGASYLEIAEVLARDGADTTRDLEELWRRIVFSICVSNCDDHLRNHGFMLLDGGWALSPAYDVNPDPYGDGLRLNISDRENSQDLGLAREVAGLFRLAPSRASQIIAEVVRSVQRWRMVATAARISGDEQDRMAPAFRVAERYHAGR